MNEKFQPSTFNFQLFKLFLFNIKIKFIIVIQIFISKLFLLKTGLECRYVSFCNPFSLIGFISIDYKIKAHSKLETNSKLNLFEQNFLAFKFNT